jgi:hypothetical protein
MQDDIARAVVEKPSIGTRARSRWIQSKHGLGEPLGRQPATGRQWPEVVLESSFALVRDAAGRASALDLTLDDAYPSLAIVPVSVDHRWYGTAADRHYSNLPKEWPTNH